MKRRFHIRNIAFLFVAVFILTMLPSCGEDDGSGYIFKMNIENNPRNLDPQIAVDSESVMIITNMMEGLMRVGASGEIVPAAAESFTMSDDGLTYTFNLKKGHKWESLADFSAEVTADDFVYAFQRIFDAETASPYSGDYMCIKNAAAVLNGTKPVQELGVRAVDEYTVEFTLAYPYYDFLALLAKPAAMPCSREFFEFTRGRYGMAADASASNGAFYLKEWNYDPYWDNNYIIMRRNKAYSEENYVYPYSLNFFITGGSVQDSESYSADNVQCYVSEVYDEKVFAESKVSEHLTKTAGLIFNLESEYFGKVQFREALAKNLNRDYFIHKLPNNLEAAFGIIPGSVTIQGKSYRDLVSDRVLSVYSADSSRLWDNALKSVGEVSVDGVKITVPDSFQNSEMIYGVTEQWQSELLFYCGVEVVSQNEYDSKLESGDYDIALIELSASENSADEFLNVFISDERFKGYSNPKLSAHINGGRTAGSLTEGAELYKYAEQEIIGDYIFIPLFYEKEYFVTKDKTADLIYYPFSSAVQFKDAKYFD
ncbi:MAG: peptide ABC transporter substrate-binding protein [Oscillospiraceae bacterium]|nr:peptide ABC transporter substrate-binding protein [Oscillospiraceae bacterium]